MGKSEQKPAIRFQGFTDAFEHYPESAAARADGSADATAVQESEPKAKDDWKQRTAGNSIPQIRFKGFTDPWEQRRLIDEVSSVDTGKSKFTTHETGLYEILGSTSVIGYDNSYDYEGDFLLTARVGANAGELYRHSGKVKISDNTVFIQGEQLDFVYYALLNFDIKKLSFGTGQPLVKASELKEQIISMPASEAEREAIGRYFHSIDNLITLHQRKYDKLVNVKKSMLEKMFPRDGASVPEIRFAGFTAPWEQRKVGDFLTVSKIPGHTGVDARKLTVKLWGKGVVEKTDLYGGSENTQYYIRRAGQFMYGKLDFLHAAFGIVPKNLDKYESTLDSPAFDLEGIDGQFLLNRVTQEDFYLKNGLVANGSRKAKRIHENTFMAMPILVPSIEEQRRIGNFFVTLDNLINLHQRKLEKLKNIKKSMLVKMFV